MRRGEVWYADLNPVRGSEADKTRPVVVVSNDVANQSAAKLGRGVVTIVPLTSSTQHIYSFQVLIPVGDAGLPEDSKAQAEQVRSIDQARLIEYVGQVPSALMSKLDDALRLHLAL
jgi:mRNA interferase MazF